MLAESSFTMYTFIEDYLISQSLGSSAQISNQTETKLPSRKDGVNRRSNNNNNINKNNITIKTYDKACSKVEKKTYFLLVD